MITPTLESVLSLAIEARLLDLHTALPGIVESFDSAKGSASVRPSLKRKFEDGTILELPLVVNVPVIFPSSSSWSLTGPISPGDAVLLIFSERSLDVWKKQGGIVDPQNPRKHHLTDAICIPGLFASAQGPVASNDLVLKHEEASLTLKAAGKFSIQGSSGELLDTLTQIAEQLKTLCQTLSTDTVNPGTMMLNAGAQYAALQTQVTTLKGILEGIKA